MNICSQVVAAKGPAVEVLPVLPAATQQSTDTQPFTHVKVINNNIHPYNTCKHCSQVVAAKGLAVEVLPVLPAAVQPGERPAVGGAQLLFFWYALGRGGVCVCSRETEFMVQAGEGPA